MVGLVPYTAALAHPPHYTRAPPTRPSSNPVHLQSERTPMAAVSGPGGAVVQVPSESVPASLLRMYRAEGIRTLYRGGVPLCIRAFPVSAAECRCVTLGDVGCR